MRDDRARVDCVIRPASTLEAQPMAGCLFVLDNLGVGGSERKTILVANRLAERGRPVHLAFLNVSHDISDTIHPDIQQLVLNRKGKLDFGAIGALREYVQGQDIGTVWAVNLYPLLYAFGATRLGRRQVRLVGSSNITLFRNWYERLKMRVYSPILKRVDAFVFGSYGQMTLWKRQYGLDSPAMAVIHNGVLTDHFSPGTGADRAQARAHFGLDPAAIVLGNVAQFRVEKAQGDLVEAARLLLKRGRRVQLLMVGEGNRRPIVEAQVRQVGMSDSVCFAGLLEDVRPALRAVDIFVLSSVSETFSNAALEAMSMGLPVVLSDVGGASEMVSSGINGYLYPPGNSVAMADRLEKLLVHGEIERLGRNARKLVLEQFSADAMTDQYEMLIWGNCKRSGHEGCTRL